VNKETNEEYDA